MSHLSRDERLLALDGALAEARQAHLASCAACRTEVDGLRAVLARVRAVDVPEPSPLFWDHLAARVGDAIAREPAPAAGRAWWSPRLAWAAVAVIVTAAAAGYLTRPAVPPTAPTLVQGVSPAPAVTPADPPRGTEGDAVADVAAAADDEGWALLAAVAEDGAADDELFVPPAGAVELSLSALSPAERSALAQELSAALSTVPQREG